MKRLGAFLAGAAAIALTLPGVASAEQPPLTVGSASIATQTEPSGIDVMALWSHPDDDAGFTTPCGVWNDLYGIRCGIIMVTRGEGGSNSVGSESGPELGLRRENEDRTSHVRSGTVDIFNIDKVDFYYNTSAPLTQRVWDGEDTLRRVVRVIRETRPGIMIGWPPNFDYGHGNHQYAGRLVWEAVEAASDPARFPEQLTGLGAVKPWQVKKIIMMEGWRASFPGSGGQLAPDCNAGFVPDEANPFTVAGTWGGYESPYTWVAGNTAGIPAGTPKTWAQVGREGGRAHPTQARVMQKEPWDATCMRFGVLKSLVPMQPNGTPAGDKDDSLFQGVTVPDAGGLPLGTGFAISPTDFFTAPGEPLGVDVELTLPEGTIPSGSITLGVPDGWNVSAPVAVGGERTAKASFQVTPSADADPAMYRLTASFSGGDKTAWNDTRVQVVPPVEGLFARGGSSQELDAWQNQHNVHLYGRSPAIAEIGAGESRTVSIEVTNRTSQPQTGTVNLAVPDGFTVDATGKSFDAVPPGSTQRVEFLVTHTDPAADGQQVKFTATTVAGQSSSQEELQMYLVPSVVIPQLAAAPVIDGAADDLEGAAVPVGQKWEGDDCAPDGTDCGTGGQARLGWHDDALYAHVRVIDDVASAAATPDRCFGHWLVDSVEFLVDPRGDSSDTSTTFKLGVFPVTNDPGGSNGNGIDGPCWSRDADNHQGFSTGPLAANVEQGPNAPGVEVAAKAVRNSDGTWADGVWDVELKVPMSVLPAAAGATGKAPTGDAATNETNAAHVGLNVTPYDSDTQDFIGQTRTAWSAFGSQQSEPYRWGHAYLDGYAPPSDRATEPKPPVIPQTALAGTESPQSIHQSATRGVTLSGAQPSDALTVTDVKIRDGAVEVSYEASRSGLLRGFVWRGDPRFIPVWTSSCPGDQYGFDACSEKDGAAPRWDPDMSGRLKASGRVDVVAGTGTLMLPLTPETRAAIAANSRVLLAWAEVEGGDGVNAWEFPIQAGGPSPSPSPGPKPGLPDTGY